MQIGELQVGRQQFLLRLEQLCPALDEVRVERAAILHLLDPLAL
jgi:hypothetical protein